MWKRILTDRPPVNERIIVTDGETRAICRCIVNDEHIEWLFDSPAFSDIKIDYWMELPELPPKINQVSAETNL